MLTPQIKMKGKQQRANAYNEEVLKTKVQNICFNIRKERRDFDKAQLLELLTEKLLKQDKCILALKIKKDDLNGASLIDNLNEIIKFKSATKMIELLLQLQDTGKEPQSTQISDYGKRLMQQAAQNDTQFVKPDAVEYHYTDTNLIDRNKSQNSIYPSFNDLAFENQDFKYQFDGVKSFKEQIEIQTRFNQEFKNKDFLHYNKKLGSQEIEQPSFLFGAFKRIQPSCSISDNPFGIKFEIPPLPALPNFSQDFANLPEAPNFFSFIKTDENNNDIFRRSSRSPSQKQNQSSQESKISWPSSVDKNKKSGTKQLQSTNRRVLKQKYKKQLNKKSLIWNLMPYLNEDKLKNNIQEASGLLRFWEDENLDVKMRELRVSEGGLITQQKLREFNKEYLISTEDEFAYYDRKKFTEQEVVTMSLLMLQGVPSQLFLLRNEKLTFLLRPNYEIQSYNLNQESCQSIFESLMDCGSFFLHLREFTDYMSISQNNGGKILQNFVIGISEFLTFYYNQIDEVKLEVLKRREFENQHIFTDKTGGQTQKETSVGMTLLELVTHTRQLQNQIRLVATICFTQKFISDVDLSSNEMAVDEEKTDKVQKIIRKIYNNQNLREKFKDDIEKIRTKVWLENFPTGSKLLSYLYRILLCCESDLHAIDLLQRLFQKAIQPLIQMINSFIFNGDFEDPYQEFFIEKLYRKGVSQNMLKPQDYLFKITSYPLEKVPVFLLETVTTIFKAGSSLHLLKKQGIQQQLYDDTSQVKQYFDICSNSVTISGVNELNHPFKNRFMTEDYQPCSNFIKLDFEIESLRKDHDAKTHHFEAQTEQLQQIEMSIVRMEEETYYQKLLMIEMAKREYAEKREREQEEERQRKIEKHQAYLRQVQQQVDELQRRKEEEKLAKRKEIDAVRKEQEEYEAKKKMVEEELKRQLMEALKENQTLGQVGMAQELDRGEQELEQKILQIQEEKEQVEYNGRDIEIQIENERQLERQSIIKLNKTNIDVEMMESEQLERDQGQNQMLHREELIFLQNEEEKKQEESNPLLSIINEALQKAEQNLNQSIMMQEKETLKECQHDNQGQILEMDEIQILNDNNQKHGQYEVQELSSQQKVDMITDVFLKLLFEAVNKRIDDIEKIRKKRYTWNKIKKEQQIQKYQEQKSKWRYQEPTVSIKTKLNLIFQEFESKSNAHQAQEVKQVGIYSAPVTLAVQQCIQHVVRDQFKLINKCLIHLMFRRLRLYRQLEALKQFYFCYQGDIISLFMESLFKDDYESSVKENSLSFINSQFDLAIKLSHPEQYESQSKLSEIGGPGIGGFNSLHLSGNFEFRAVDPNEAYNNSQYSYFTAFNMQNYIKLIFKRKYPLDLVISDSCIEKYNTIFFFIVKLKRINQILSQLWKYLSTSEFRKLPFSDYCKVRKLQLLRNKMYHFTSMLEQYALTEVIEASWQTFKNNLPNQTIFEDLVKLHNDFLDQIMVKCFIDKKDHKIMGQITKLYSFVLQFNRVVREHGAEIVHDFEAIKEIDAISLAFDRYTFYLYQLVKMLASKGSFKELFLRLDFNKFYDRGGQNSFDQLN